MDELAFYAIDAGCADIIVRPTEIPERILNVTGQANL